MKNVLFVQYPWRGAGDVRLPDGRTFKIDLSPIGFATEYARFGGIGRKSAVVAALSDSSARVSLLDSHGSEECLHAEVVSTAGAPAQGAAAELRWGGAPGSSGGAAFSFP